MKKEKSEIKAELMKEYSKALDQLLEENEKIEGFAELEEAVTRLAEKTLPKTLSQIQKIKAFSP